MKWLISVVQNSQHPFFKRLKTAWQSLTEPVVTIENSHQREQTRLLTSLLLGAFICGIPVAFIPLLFNLDQGWASVQAWNGFIEVAVVYLLYRYTRRGHYQLAVRLIALLGSASVLLGAFLIGGQNGLRTLYYLTVVLIFAGLFLSQRFTLLLIGAQIALMLVYGWFNHDITIWDVVLGPVMFTVVLGALTTLIVGHRARLDQMQQTDLIEAKERYRLISEMISDYAYAYRVEPDGSFVREWLTDSFTRVMGYSTDAVQNNTNLNMYHPDDQPKVEEHLQAVLRGEERSDEYRVLTKDGEERLLRLSRRPVWDSDHKRVVRIYGVAQDITAQKQADERKFEIALAQARFDLVHRFFRAISHDFRTSLSIIETNRYLIERLLERGQTEDVRCRLQHISEQVARLTEQLENLKVVSSLNSPVMELCDLNALAQAEAAAYQDELEERHLHLNLELDPSRPTVRANPEEMRRAMGHLLENAIHFTSEGGTITLHTSQAQKTVRLDVRDTGIGIKPEDMPHIFDFFYRADEARSIESGGVGLGLSIVKMVAEAYSGKITAISQPGKGSTFTLEFPSANAH